MADNRAEHAVENSPWKIMSILEYDKPGTEDLEGLGERERLAAMQEMQLSHRGELRL